MRRFLVRLLELLAVIVGFFVWMMFTYRPYSDYLAELHLVVYLPVIIAAISSLYLLITNRKDTIKGTLISFYDIVFLIGCVFMLYVEKIIYSFYYTTGG